MPGILRTLAAATLLAALPATTGHAAPQPAACPLVADDAGDGRPTLVPIHSGQLDILGIDLASGRDTVVTRMHVASLAHDALTPFGIKWTVDFGVGGTRYFSQVTYGTTLPSLDYHYSATFRSINGLPAPAAFAVDPVAATLTVTVPRSAIPELATPGQVFDQIGGSTGWYTNNADSAGDGAARYVDRKPGCVPAA